MSGPSRPPARVKNFSPLRLHGWWLAVSCTEPSQARSCVTINMAGVEERPQSSTWTPHGSQRVHNIAREDVPRKCAGRARPRRSVPETVFFLMVGKPEGKAVRHFRDGFVREVDFFARHTFARDSADIRSALELLPVFCQQFKLPLPIRRRGCAAGFRVF